MAEIDRLSQYRYLIRAMRVEDARSLQVARRHFSRAGIDPFDDGFVFRHTPHNHDFSRVTQDFFGLIHEWRVPGRRNFRGILKQYLAIFFDEVCCGSWDLYLALEGDGLCTCCEFCGSLHDLDGRAIDRGPSVIANRKMLVARLGEATEAQWSSLATLAPLERARRERVAPPG